MKGFAALGALAALAACSPESAPVPTATPSPRPTIAQPRTLVAADYDPGLLGARVAGAVVADAALGRGKAPLARYSAFVACAREVTVCDPAQLPQGALYTYVLTITPAASPAPSPGAASPGGVAGAGEAPAELVRMTRAAPGFKGAVGFSRAEAEAALGSSTAMAVKAERERLIWRVDEGRAWQAGKPITLWWQSSVPPGEMAQAYHFEYAGRVVDVTAPFPAQPVPPRDRAAKHL